MVTFTRTGNSVEVDFDGVEVQYISPESSVQGKNSGDTVVVADNLKGGNSNRTFRILTVNINGRPSDDAAVVAEWLRDTYFSGQNYGGVGGGGGDATAANQVIQIARLDTIIVDLADIEAELVSINADTTSMDAKMASSLVVEPHDSREITYRTSGNGIGEIDYVRYMSGITEVARLTFTYDTNNDLISIVKT